MVKYILKRLLQSVVTVLLVVSIVFLLLRMMPSDYFFTEDELMKFTEEQKEAKLERLGLREICPECHGAAVLENGELCPRCHVEKKCTTCEGDGKVNVICADCGGTGKNKIEIQCPSCAGSGLYQHISEEDPGITVLESCKDCEGTGVVSDSKLCDTCAGRGKLNEEIPCTECDHGMIIRKGTGYVDRSKLAQLGDFFGNMLEYRAYTPSMINKAAIERFSATAFVSKDYTDKKDKSLTEIKATNEAGAKQKVYIDLSEGDSKKDAYLENGVLYVKKNCEVLEDQGEVPEGMTAVEVTAEDGAKRRVAVFISENEHADTLKATLTEEVEYRDYTILGDGEQAPEGMTVKEIKVGDTLRRIALKVDEGEVFQGVEVTVKEEDKTVPFFTYLFARLRGENPFEGIGTDTTYIRVNFNLGKSIRLEKGQYVIDVIGVKIGPSMEIGLIALAISLVLGVAIGVLQARNRVVDAIGTGYTVLVNAVPHLVIYTIIMMLGAMAFGLPMRYDGTAENAAMTKVLPIFCLSVASTVYGG